MSRRDRMPGAARRSLVLAVVIIGITALVVSRALGGAADGVTAQLHPPASLGGTPSVSAPSVPQVPVPSVPHVPAPSVPSAPSAPSAPSVPGAPSVSVPGVAGGSGSASGSAGSSAAATATSGGRTPGAAGASGRGGSAANGGVHAASTQTPAERRQRRSVKEASMRRDVERYSGCLGDLPGLEGRVLTIRAGLGDRSPASRS